MARSLDGVRAITADGLGWEVEAQDLTSLTPILVARLAQAGASILEVAPRRVSLEQAYLRAVGSA
jgi:hypothetical protein